MDLMLETGSTFRPLEVKEIIGMLYTTPELGGLNAKFENALESWNQSVGVDVPGNEEQGQSEEEQSASRFRRLLEAYSNPELLPIKMDLSREEIIGLGIGALVAIRSLQDGASIMGLDPDTGGLAEHLRDYDEAFSSLSLEEVREELDRIEVASGLGELDFYKEVINAVSLCVGSVG